MQQPLGTAWVMLLSRTSLLWKQGRFCPQCLPVWQKYLGLPWGLRISSCRCVASLPADSQQGQQLQHEYRGLS